MFRLSESFRGYRNDRFFKFVSVVVLEFRLPREQWFLQAGTAWRNHCSQGNFQQGGNQESCRDLSLSPYVMKRSPIRRFSCRSAKELNPVYCEHSVSMQTCTKTSFCSSTFVCWTWYCLLVKIKRFYTVVAMDKHSKIK